MQTTYKYSSKLKPIRNNEEMEDDENQGGLPFIALNKKPYREYAQTFSAQQIHYYISEGIKGPNEYTDMIHRIAVASPADVVYIHLNTPGGHLDTGIQLVNAMRNSQAKIVTCLEGAAYSLGTLIFLAGDEMVVNDNCTMMFHNFSGGLIGKGNEMIAELQAAIEGFAALAKDYYLPFLTEDEVERIIRGEDIWMHSPEVRERLEKMAKALADDEAVIEAALDALEEEAELLEAEEAAKAAKPKAKVKAKPKTTPKRGRRAGTNSTGPG